MTRLKRKYFLLALALMPVIVYLASVLYLNQLKKPLMGFSIKGLQVGENSPKYDVIDGDIYQQGKPVSFITGPRLYKKVISLAYFYKVTKEEPLFTSPGMDYQKFAASIEVLADYHNELLKKLKLKDNVVPLNFLKSIPKVAASHSLFIKKPTARNAAKLISSYESAQKNYRADLAGLIKKVEQFFPYENEQEFVSLGSATSNKTILDDWRLMLKNAGALKKEINYRQGILANGTYSDKTRAIKLKNLKKYPEDVPLLKTEELVVQEEFQDKLRGPYIVETAALKRKVSPEYYYVYDVYYRNRMVFMTKLATDNFYERITPITSVEKNLIKEGYKWKPNWDGNTYHFTDNEWQVKLLTLDNFLRRYGKINIFNKISKREYFRKLDNKTRQFIEKAAKVEDEFFVQKMPSETNLGYLADYWQRAYELLKSEGSYSNRLNADKEQLLQRYLSVNSRLLGLESIFKSTLYLDNLLIRAQLGTLDKRIGSFLYAMRNGYSLSFLSFSPNIWRLPKRPKFMKKTGYFPRKSTYTSYTKLRKKYSAKEIISWRQHNELKLLNMFRLAKAKNELKASLFETVERGGAAANE